MRGFRVRLGLLVLAAGIGGVLWLRPDTAPPAAWRTEALRRADITATVSATGTLEAVTTVEVGTQVSGQIAALHADFNDTVTTGQLLARIDPTLLRAALRAAEADHDLDQANLKLAAQELARVEALFTQGAATQAELDAAQAAQGVAQAQVRASAVDVQRARDNLAYTEIRSPIDGTVLRRDVDAGQTVNAGMSAPTLFLLAGDLRQMQILTAVDEADIARVHEGQEVRFTVSAHGERRFEGRVEQVRLQSTLTENVVTYAVVVSVENREGLLMPGMTATVDFVVEVAEGALCAPSAALRFRPEPEDLAPSAQSEAPADRRGRKARGPTREGTLHVVGAAGLEPRQVKLGAADRECTAVEGEGVAEGLEVVIGAPLPGDAAGKGLLQTGTQRFRPGGF